MHANTGDKVTLLTVKSGDTRKLPASTQGFSAGLGWDAKGGVGASPDFDLWILRHRVNTADVIAWANKAWERPDLGRNGQNNPFVATPELDVIYKGDDRTGAESDTGYDENVDFDLNKAPADVTSYSVWATIYDEDKKGLTLAEGENVKFGIVDNATGNGVQTDPAANQSFDVTMLLAIIVKNDDGSWSLTAADAASRGQGTKTMFDIAREKGATV